MPALGGYSALNNRKTLVKPPRHVSQRTKDVCAQRKGRAEEHPLPGPPLVTYVS
jgi:hypothetical protein